MAARAVPLPGPLPAVPRELEERPIWLYGPFASKRAEPAWVVLPARGSANPIDCVPAETATSPAVRMTAERVPPAEERSRSATAARSPNRNEHSMLRRRRPTAAMSTDCGSREGRWNESGAPRGVLTIHRHGTFAVFDQNRTAREFVVIVTCHNGSSFPIPRQAGGAGFSTKAERARHVRESPLQPATHRRGHRRPIRPGHRPVPQLSVRSGRRRRPAILAVRSRR